MEGKKTRKTDRRTLCTCAAIRDALLSLLAEKEYTDISVSDLCRAAEISRGTFYLHYDNISQVLGELFDGALENIQSVLVQIGCESAEEEKCALPLCRFLRENRKYRPLFFSESLQGQLIERIMASGWESFREKLGRRSGERDEVLRALFCFQLNGCLAVSRQNVGLPDAEWAQIRCRIDGFLRSGFQALQAPGRALPGAAGETGRAGRERTE